MPAEPLEVDVAEAKTSLEDLIERARAGEEIVISEAGKAAVKLVPTRHTGEPSKPRKRQLGRWKGRIWVADDFDDPLPEMEPYT